MTHRPVTWNGEPVPYDEPVAELARRTASAGPRCFAAFVALAHHEDAAALEVLRDRCRDPDDRLRRASVEAIGHRADGGEAAEVVRARMGDEVPSVIVAACEAAGALVLVQVRPRLLRLMAVRDALVRKAAVSALRTVWRPHDFGPVFRLLRSDSSTDVRDAAAWTLRAVTPTMTTANARALFAVWHKADLARQRQWACEIAAEFGLHAELVPVRELLQDPDGHVRKAAERALASLMPAE